MAKILLIDDSATVLSVMSTSLAVGGMSVVTASNGLSGLKAARIENPDIIILDIGLPDMSGLDLLSKLKEDTELKDIPVLLLTGRDDSSAAQKGMTMGASGFMVKHSTPPKALLSRIQAILERTRQG